MSAYLEIGSKIWCKKRYLFFKPSMQLMHEWLNLCTTFYGLFFWKRRRQLKTSTKASYFRRLCYGARKLLEMVWDGKFGDKLIQCALRLVEHLVTKRYVAFRSFSSFYWITNITIWYHWVVFNNKSYSIKKIRQCTSCLFRCTVSMYCEHALLQNLTIPDFCKIFVQ